MSENQLTEDEREVFAALTAFQFMLENLYALVMSLDGGTVQDVRETRDEMLRQFEDLPFRGGEDVIPEESYLLRQHALARLERMWASIEARVAQGFQEDAP